jgi:hypothetical protein
MIEDSEHGFILRKLVGPATTESDSPSQNVPCAHEKFHFIKVAVLLSESGAVQSSSREFVMSCHFPTGGARMGVAWPDVLQQKLDRGLPSIQELS